MHDDDTRVSACHRIGVFDFRKENDHLWRQILCRPGNGSPFGKECTDTSIHSIPGKRKGRC
jgi:hypothetical protein